MSESCHFGHTPVQDRSNDTKGKPQRVSVWHQKGNSTQVSQFQGYVRFLGQPKHAFIYDSGAKLTALGIHRLKADPTVQEESPRTVPVRHQRDNKKPAKPARPCQHPCIKNKAARTFPIQFSVLYYL